ncbi:disintegrin and metalloproteinase domain-containing protein 21-like [Sceloporus undulatus]|uniref:disintegrin and metalloproteinase domain-containing protein 21-like n=1 Tax=Sceloporus undulatus TaxID=8520 RepID=UPI001C4A996F|nr:disintegrin and metalloproteinase domain-containing protein 21-like [Sceloporus undulatus]
MVNNSAWLSLLILWNVPRETESSKPPHSSKYASYEVTIPRKVMPRYGHQETLEVTYHLQIEGKGRMVHLWQKKSFIPKNFPVFTYSKQGELQVDYPFISTDCFYQGYVEGEPSSLVTLSTCSGGFRGLFQLENNTYEIEPVQASPNFQHVVYLLEEKEIDANMKCGLTEEEQSRQEAMLQDAENLANKTVSGRGWWLDTRYVEIAIVVGHNRYVDFDKNETHILLLFMDLVHSVSSRYDPLSVQLTLVGLEMWSENNIITISESIYSTLDTFTKWRSASLLKRLENDVGYLFLSKPFLGVGGLAYLGTACSNEKGSGLVSIYTYSFSEYSMVFAHELGHNLGMKHDDSNCNCGKQVCIMSEALTNGYKFSNCSRNDYFKRMNSKCLLLPPDVDKVIRIKYCGDNIVENEEECDCGSIAQCQLDPCCQSGCKMRPGAICAFGKCCVNCKFIPAQVVCRRNISVCDLPEYCNGSSQFCPEDVYVQDGAPCNDKLHCYHGKCITINDQCKMMFGARAIAAPEGCYKRMNTRGDRFGNCGIINETYTKCRAKNVLCGRKQCQRIYDLEFLGDHQTAIQTVVDNNECWGTDYHFGMDSSDVGAVHDGTPCGTGMICFDHKCENVSLLNYDCDFEKCNQHGICNSNKNCHCDYGWAPPDCIEKGFGGSIDSGPPPRQKRRLILSKEEKLFSYIFLPLVAIFFCIIIVFRNELIYQYTKLKKRIQSARKKDNEMMKRSSDMRAVRLRMMQNA